MSSGSALRQQAKRANFGFKPDESNHTGAAIIELYLAINEARWRRRYAEERQHPELVDIGGEGGES